MWWKSTDVYHVDGINYSAIKVNELQLTQFSRFRRAHGRFCHTVHPGGRAAMLVGPPVQFVGVVKTERLCHYH